MKKMKVFEDIPHYIVIDNILVFIEMSFLNYVHHKWICAKEEILKMNPCFIYFGYFNRDITRKIFMIFKSIDTSYISRVSLILEYPKILPIIDFRRIYYLCIGSGSDLYMKYLLNIDQIYIKRLCLKYNLYKIECLFSNNRFPELEYLKSEENIINNYRFEKLRTLKINSSGLLRGENIRMPKVQNFLCGSDERYISFRYIKNLPSCNLVKLELLAIGYFNWKIFESEQVLNLKYIGLEKVTCCSIFFGCLFEGESSDLVEWVHIKELGFLKVYDCPEIDERCFVNQTFENLEELYVDLNQKITGNFFKNRMFPKLKILGTIGTTDLDTREWVNPNLVNIWKRTSSWEKKHKFCF